jgi:hypothetical protein
LDGYGIWTLKLKEEDGFRVTEDYKLFESQRRGVTGGWRKVHIEEPH